MLQRLKMINLINISLIFMYISTYIFIDSNSYLWIYWISIGLFIFLATSSLLFFVDRRIKLNELMVYSFFLTTYLVVSFIWSVDYKVNSIIKIFIFLCISILISEIYGKYTKGYIVLLKDLFIGGVILVIYIFYTFGFYNIVNNMYIGVRVGGNGIINENTLGIVMSETALIAIYLYSRNIMDKIIFWPSFIIISLLALGTGSRKAALILILGIIMLKYFVFSFKWILSLAIIASVIIMVQSTFDFTQLSFVSRFETLLNVFRGGHIDGSTLERLYMTKVAYLLFLDRPILGYGFGFFGDYFLQVEGVMTYSHNNYLEILVSIGVVGLIIYYSIYMRLLNKFYKLIKDNGMLSMDSEIRIGFTLLLLQLITDFGNVTCYSLPVYIFLGMYYILVNCKYNEIGNSRGGII